jgi:hypothetical protein
MDWASVLSTVGCLRVNSPDDLTCSGDVRISLIEKSYDIIDVVKYVLGSFRHSTNLAPPDNPVKRPGNLR